jgi:hypothetical protein
MQVKWLIRRRPATARDGQNAPEKAEGRQFDDSVLIAATTGAAGQLPFVYGWHG